MMAPGIYYVGGFVIGGFLLLCVLLYWMDYRGSQRERERWRGVKYSPYGNDEDGTRDAPYQLPD